MKGTTQRTCSRFRPVLREKWRRQAYSDVFLPAFCFLLHQQVVQHKITIQIIQITSFSRRSRRVYDTHISVDQKAVVRLLRIDVRSPFIIPVQPCHRFHFSAVRFHLSFFLTDNRKLILHIGCRKCSHAVVAYIPMLVRTFARENPVPVPWMFRLFQRKGKSLRFWWLRFLRSSRWTGSRSATLSAAPCKRRASTSN